MHYFRVQGACLGAGGYGTCLSRSQACKTAYVVMLRDRELTAHVFVKMISFAWDAASLEQRESGTQMDYEISSTFRINPLE